MPASIRTDPKRGRRGKAPALPLAPSGRAELMGKRGGKAQSGRARRSSRKGGKKKKKKDTRAALPICVVRKPEKEGKKKLRIGDQLKGARGKEEKVLCFISPITFTKRGEKKRVRKRTKNQLSGRKKTKEKKKKKGGTSPILSLRSVVFDGGEEGRRPVVASGLRGRGMITSPAPSKGKGKEKKQRSGPVEARGKKCRRKKEKKAWPSRLHISC